MLAKTMTLKQRQWLEHVKIADSGSDSIADYALANDLRLKSLYQWKSKLVKLGIYHPDQPPPDNNFVQVKPVSEAQSSGCTLRLTNGSHLEFHGELSAVSIRSIITSASGRR